MNKKIQKLLYYNIVMLLGCLFFVVGVSAATKVDGTGKVFWRDVFSAGGDYSFGRAVALDNNNYPHICGYRNTEGVTYAVVHAYWDGSTWNYENIATALNLYIGRYCSIAIDQSNNDVHVSYSSGEGDLDYAKKSNGAWATTTVDNGNTGRYSGIQERF